MKSHKPPTRRRKTIVDGPTAARLLEEICRQPEAHGLDIAILNLKCALALPHAEDLSIPRCLERLDQMARRVRHETNRNLHRYHERPGEWDNSEAQWRAGMMITVLHQDFGVRYNPERIYDPDFRDSRDLFIHGVLFGHGGTCASMPVLYVGIGRRLGYPLRLVSAKAHGFARWDDSDGKQWGQPARFNFEGSGLGFKTYPDEFYHEWPLKLHHSELAEGRFLRSLAPREELACFLASRGHCLQDTKRFAEAAQVFRWAAELDPIGPPYAAFRNVAMALAGIPVPPGFEQFAREAEKERARINDLDK
jgi:hypothetical protein